MLLEIRRQTPRGQASEAHGLASTEVRAKCVESLEGQQSF